MNLTGPRIAGHKFFQLLLCWRHGLLNVVASRSSPRAATHPETAFLFPRSDFAVARRGRYDSPATALLFSRSRVASLAAGYDDFVQLKTLSQPLTGSGLEAIFN